MTAANRIPDSAAPGVRAVRNRAGFARVESPGLVQIEGADRIPFLQNQLPADVAALAPGSGAHTAYLDAKGRITHEFVLLVLADSVRILIAADRTASLIAKLERFHIREAVTFADRSAAYRVLELHGPEFPAILAAASGTRVDPSPYRHADLAIGGDPVWFVAHPWTGDPGGRLLVPVAAADRVVEALRDAGASRGLVELDPDSLEMLRIEGGQPRFGIDFDERTLLPELGREEMVSHRKGCYLGQETVARIHSRGKVNRLLLGLVIEGDRVPEPGTLVLHEDQPVGETRSATRSVSLGQPVALALLRTRVADPGTVVHLRIDQRTVAARVQELPLYHPPGPAEQAETLYREGMEAFKADRFEEARNCFERATLMNPHHHAAFESMGVCLERLGRLEEAMETMVTLTEMDPANIMAWTNLSRYHAEAGRIEEAEKLKGHVTFLVWKREAGEKEAARKQQEDAAQRRARLEERIGLFRDVLTLDPEDVVANFGLGKVYLDLERYAEAVPHFEKAIAQQKHYSMAYNHLGTCLERLGRREAAAEVFRAGIAAATERGDLIPKRDMTRKLESILAS